MSGMPGGVRDAALPIATEKLTKRFGSFTVLDRLDLRFARERCVPDMTAVPGPGRRPGRLVWCRDGPSRTEVSASRLAPLVAPLSLAVHKPGHGRETAAPPVPRGLVMRTS